MATQMRKKAVSATPSFVSLVDWMLLFFGLFIYLFVCLMLLLLFYFPIDLFALSQNRLNR